MPRPALQDFHAATRDAKKIVVVDLGFLGDTVHLLPALWELKRNYPGAALHVVAAPVGAEVLRMTSCVDRAWPLMLDPARRTLGEQWRLVRALRRERFDLAINFSGADRTLFLTALTAARWRVACRAGRDHFWNKWLIPHWAPRPDRALPVFEQRRQMLKVCGLALDAARFGLEIPASAKEWAAQVVRPPAIHFSLNASSPLKEWPLRHWNELGKEWLRRRPHWTIVATGSAQPREQDRLREFATAIGSERVKVMPPGSDIAQLAALLSRCEVHVGADSGVLHLAMALGVPTVALFRDYAGTKEWLPQGPRHRHVLAPCACADVKNPACAAAAEARCLAEIPPAQLAGLLGELTAPA